MSLKPRDEDSNINLEPKFGSQKNLVNFADLAMKSKAQAAKALSVKPKGRPGRKPKKVGRKKVSARISLEQSEIEDTPCLLALQASRDTDMINEESSAIIEEILHTEKILLYIVVMLLAFVRRFTYVTKLGITEYPVDYQQSNF